MAKLKWISFILLFLFQNGVFYSQLSGMEFERQQGYWSTGVQYGNSFQWSDVPSETNGWGTSLTLGKNLLYKENALLAFDLRSRLFFGVSKGLDSDADANIVENKALNGQVRYDYLSEPGFIFYNYKNSLFGLDAEANLIINRFRARTGWFINLVGGGSLGVFSTRMNLADDSGPYRSDFAAINQNQSSKNIKSDLRTLMDDSYESYANGFQNSRIKAGFMPTAGIELGYDINRFLTAYLGHRTLFSRTDFLDGNNLGDPDQDLHHFTHLGLQVHFMKNQQKRRSNSWASAGFESQPMGLIDEDPEHGFPLVEITYPEVDWFNTSKGEMEVLAKLQNVYSILDISCTVNGKEVSFDYDKDQVKFYAYFQRGTNVLKVQVRNDKGEARDIKRVIFTPVDEEAGPVADPAFAKPIIELVSPADASYYASEDVFTIQAYIENVESKDDIKLNANGMELSSFKFDPSFGNLSLKVRLARGTNKFLLTAYNGTGKTEQEFFIFFGVDPEEEVVVTDDPDTANEEEESFPPIESNTKPSISLLSPSSNPFYTKSDEVFIQAEMHGSSDPEDIEFTVNGIRNYLFDFDRNNKVLSDKIQLLTLETEIVLSVNNSFGRAEKKLTIIYGEPETDPEPEASEPVITFRQLSEPDEDCLVNLEATIRGEVNKEDIRIQLNDFGIRNFRYDPDNRSLRVSLYLDEGANKVTVEAEVEGKVEQADLTFYCGEEEEQDPVENEPVDTSPAEISHIFPQTPYSTEEQDVILRFKAGHINSKEDVLIFHNEEIVEEFDFDPVKSEVQVLLSLAPKNNLILLRISNDYGEDEEELVYFFDEPFKTAPVVLINSPRNGFTTDESSVVFRASVEYIKKIEDVSVYLNGEKFTGFEYNEEYGKIQAYLPLQLGINTIEVVAANRMGSSREKTVFQLRHEYIPAVEITGPKEGLEYRKAFASLTGIVQNMPDKRGIGIQVNGKPHTSINFEKEKDLVTSRIQLEKGENEIVLSAKNEFGFASDTIRLFFRGVPEKPVITIRKPASSGEQSPEADYSLEAGVTEITHSSQVEVVLNGRPVEDVFYFKDEQLIRAEFRLKKGTNDIKLVATNETGSSTARTSIILR